MLESLSKIRGKAEKFTGTTALLSALAALPAAGSLGCDGGVMDEGPKTILIATKGTRLSCAQILGTDAYGNSLTPYKQNKLCPSGDPLETVEMPLSPILENPKAAAKMKKFQNCEFRDLQVETVTELATGQKADAIVIISSEATTVPCPNGKGICSVEGTIRVESDGNPTTIFMTAEDSSGSLISLPTIVNNLTHETGHLKGLDDNTETGKNTSFMTEGRNPNDKGTWVWSQAEIDELITRVQSAQKVNATTQLENPNHCAPERDALFTE